MSLSRCKTSFLCDNPDHMGGKLHHKTTHKADKGEHLKKEFNYLKMNTLDRDDVINNITFSSDSTVKMYKNMDKEKL